MSKKKDGNWFKQHKILTGVLAFFVLMLIVAATTDPDTKTKNDSSNITNQQVSVAVPKYDVAHRSADERLDNAETLYVVIDPVDLSNDSFKQNVRSIIKDIATKKNFKEFTVSIYDNADAAAWQYNMSTPSNQAEAQTKLAERGQHLVATYTGGINLDTAQKSTEDKAYTISFYPGADKTTANVGQFVGTEQFKP